MFKSFAVAALLAVSASASAQFTNGSSSSASSANTEGWSTIWVEWNPSTMKTDIKGADNKSFTGLSFGYSQAFGLTPSMPIFVEAGLGVQYSFKKEDKLEDYADQFGLNEDELSLLMNPEVKFSMFSAKIPVNLMYAFQIPNSSIMIAPYVGVTGRFNISGTNTMKYNITEDFREFMKDYYGYSSKQIDEAYGDKDSNLFDKKDMGSDKATWKRFQLGWQIGLKARFNNTFLVGVSYGTDFSQICEASKIKVATTSITLGYTF